jgi:hypothetical protein
MPCFVYARTGHFGFTYLRGDCRLLIRYAYR